MRKENTKALHKKYLVGKVSGSKSKILRDLLVHAPEDELMDFEEVLDLVGHDIRMDANTSEAIYNAVVGTKCEKRTWIIPTWFPPAVAALAIFTLLFAYFFWRNGTSSVIYSNQTNFIKEIVLEDNSTVLLRRGSSLEVLSDFKHDTIRRVRLVGEAFFTVAKNKVQPFVVEDQRNFDVKVVGTQFNLISTPSKAMLVLNTGAVEVRKGAITALVRPGERVDFDPRKQVFRIQQVDTAAHSAWKYNLIYFTGVKLSKIVDELRENYPDQSIQFDTRYGDHHFSGYLPQNNLDKTISLLNKAYNYTIITK